MPITLTTKDRAIRIPRGVTLDGRAPLYLIQTQDANYIANTPEACKAYVRKCNDFTSIDVAGPIDPKSEAALWLSNLFFGG